MVSSIEASTSSPRSCHVRRLPLPNMGIEAFPRLASLAYFQDLSTRHTTPTLRPGTPTLRKKMPQLVESPASSPVVNRHRRYSGIPRPTSGTSRRVISSSQQALQNEFSIVSTPSDSYKVNHRRPPRSDSLQSISDRPQAADQDLSGVRQQLHVRNFSTQSVKGLEALSSPCHATVRSLMRPLGPPMPRSQTVGNMSTSTGKPSSQKYKPSSNTSPEIDVVGALYESRMTQEEVDLLNRIEREKAQNKMRLLSTARRADLASPFRSITHVDQESSSDTPSLLSTRAAAARARIQQQMKRKTAESFEKSGLRIDPALANGMRTPQASLPTPKSGMSIVFSPGEDHDIDPKYVYFSESPTYWVGRYMSLCDKSKTETVLLAAMKADQQGASDAYQSSYESAESKRTRCVLDDLRSFCKTKKAIQSFKKFEETLLTSRSRTPVAINTPTITLNDTAGVEDKAVAISKPKTSWLFGPTLNSTTAASRISSVSKSMANNKMPSIAEKAGGLVKSKTTGNLAANGLHLQTKREVIVGAAALRVGKTQHTRQVSNLSVQAQINARALRERDERAIRRVDETMRRVSSRSASSTLMSVQASKHNSQRPRVQHKSDVVETHRQAVKLSHLDSSEQRVDAESHLRRPSAVSTLNEKTILDTAENRKTSIAKVVVRGLDQQQPSPSQASPQGRHNSEQRELRRRENRQSSGEILRSMVTGGLKGVRRMHRSLTGRSELEELSHVSPRGATGCDLGKQSWASRSDGVGAVG